MIKPKYCTTCGTKMEPFAKPNGYSEITGRQVYTLFLICENEMCDMLRAGARKYEVHFTHATEEKKNEWMSHHSPEKEPQPSAFEQFVNLIFRK